MIRAARTCGGDVGPAAIVGEATDSPHLFVTPEVSSQTGGYTGGWTITHAPTGLSVLRQWPDLTVQELHVLASEVAGLDWSMTEAAAIEQSEAHKRAVADALQYVIHGERPQHPTLPGKVDGIVCLDPPQVQCRGCGVIATGTPGKFTLLIQTCGILFHVADGRKQRLCAKCRAGCPCSSCGGR